MISCKTPESTEDFEKYYQLRWYMLRRPWGQPFGSEQDNREKCCFHRMIVDENKQVLAVGRLEKVSQYEGVIRYMAVRETFQRQGLGQRMISLLEVLAHQLGIAQIQLNAREGALSFYQKLGYQTQGFSHLLYSEVKHFAMTKTLKLPLSSHVDVVKQLQQTWHETIPVSKAMNIEISFYDQAQLIAHCDPKFNKNLHNTMFAGSIYTLATLTGWGWIYLQLEHKKLVADIVLADANIRYHAPIKGVAHARVDLDDVHGELLAIEQGSKAKLMLTTRLFCGDQVAATFKGTYFAIPTK